MTEVSPRSYLRDDRPRPVERSRYSRGDDEARHLSKSRRSGDKKRSKHESTSRQKPNIPREKPTFRLDVINQPAKAVVLGVEVTTSVLVSLMFTSPDTAPRKVNLDVQRLIGVVSLVAETQAGDRVPMETDTMVAEQLVGSLRPIPQEFADRLVQSQPCRVPLGFVTFRDLVIRQSGHYRLRIALLHVPGCGQSPTTISTMDSEVVRVDRRITSAQHRRQQRS